MTLGKVRTDGIVDFELFCFGKAVKLLILNSLAFDCFLKDLTVSKRLSNLVDSQNQDNNYPQPGKGNIESLNANPPRYSHGSMNSFSERFPTLRDCLHNDSGHREPPRRDLSVSPEPQRGGDAVERLVRCLLLQYTSS
jgi:hypothetical protein